jgi:hypothetical protein
MEKVSARDFMEKVSAEQKRQGRRVVSTSTPEKSVFSSKPPDFRSKIDYHKKSFGTAASYGVGWISLRT